jgi:hyaluronan synthase
LLIILSGLPIIWLALVIMIPAPIHDATGQLANVLLRYSAYIPLGIIGAWRWGVWVIKRSCAMLYVPVSESRSPARDFTLGIVTPVYNENPAVFKKALSSWQESHPDELIAVIDASDRGCISAFQEFSKGKPWAKMIVTTTPGKREALVTGIQESSAEIVALVDSDTIWTSVTGKKLLAPFSRPEIAGVTACCHPIDRHTIWQKLTDIFWNTRNYHDLPSQVVMGGALSCLSGRTSFYRREVILPKLDEFRNEIIFGARKESGEDKCLTRMVLRDGWKTYFQKDAEIYSSAAEDSKVFWSQRLRWARNSYNSDLVSLTKDKMWKQNPFLAFFMIDRFISAFTILLGPIYLGVAIYLNDWLIAASIIILWFVGRGIRIIPHLRQHPKDIVILPAYIAINFAYGALKVYALITIREQKWIRDRISVTPVSNQHKLANKIKDLALTCMVCSFLVLMVILTL